jgi:hypothetical protein
MLYTLAILSEMLLFKYDTLEKYLLVGIELTQHKIQWKAFVDMMMNLQLSYKQGVFWPK